MKILITGGAGFLGSHLTKTLWAQGHEVTVLDSLVTGSLENLETLQKEERFHFVEADVTGDEWRNALAEKHFDRIYHLACPASPIDYQQRPLETLRTCAEGTRRVLEWAESQGARLLFTSTSEVYGDPQEHPQRETYWGHVNPIGPRSCYDEGKRFAESLVTNWSQHKGVDARIVRIFNTYGPFMRAEDGRVMPNFIRQALRGEPLTIYGEGNQTRSFCYVDDMVKGLIGLMEAEPFKGPVNWGNPHETTIAELAQTVIDACGSASSIEHRPLPQDDPTQRCPDISKAREVLGFEPKVTLNKGLERTIEYFKNALK